MEKTIFKSRMSKWILRFYAFIIAVILAALAAPAFFAKDMSPGERSVFVVLFCAIALLFAVIIRRGKNMSFEIGDKLVINGVFGRHRIEFKDISEVRRSAIPSGVRIFGASLLGGYYYFPGIGTAWVSMGNFSDGVLITTVNKRNYLITPEDPDKFVAMLKDKQVKII